MFAARRNPADRSENQNHKFTDVVFREGSPSPLAVPGAVIATIWDQVFEGLRLVPRGGAEVGGLFLGRRSQDDIILAETVVPIPIAYHFGPFFRLSPSDLKNLEELIVSLQKDSSLKVVGFYRSRTRNESLSDDSESALLAAIEHSHASFASDFRYYVALTPTSRSKIMASASFRKEEGWDDWQHVTLVMNPRAPVQPIEFPPPKAPQAARAQFEQPSATTAAAPAAESRPLPLATPRPEPAPVPPPISVATPHPEPAPVPPAISVATPRSEPAPVPPPISVATPRPEPAPVPPPISLATPRSEPALVPPPIPVATPRSEPAPVSPASPTGEPRNLLDEEARALQPEPDPRHEVAVWVPSEPPTQEGGARVLWYAAGAALLAAIALGIYFPISSAHHSATLPQSIPAQAPQASAPAPAPAAVGIGFSAAPEGALWRLTWDRSAVDALHASSAVLSIRDGAKQQRVRLTLPDLTIGNVAYTPQSDNLVFSLKIAVPGGQVVEEQVRVLGALPKVETAKVSSESGSKAVEPVPVRTLRPFALTPNQPKDSSAGNRAVEVPPPPVLPSATNQPLSAVLPSTAVAPVQPSAGIAKPPSSPPANSVPARVDMARQLVGLWDATLSQSPFPTETATTSVNVYTGNVTGWFLGKYKIPRNGPPLKQPVSFQFQGNSEKDRLPDGAWLFTFRSADGWYGTIKLRPQGNTLDVMWKASLNDGKTYMFEHVMGHSAAQ